MAADYVINIGVKSTGTQGLKQIQEAAEKAKAAIGQIKDVNANIGVSFKKLEETASASFSKIGGFIKGALGIGAAFEAVEFVKSSKEAFDDLEKSVTRVNTVIRSTRGAAGFSGEQIEDQAKELSKSIVNGRSEILDAQGMLLSFTQIKGPVFGQATQAVADFATFYKEDMTAAALSIGKALNNPLTGMARLQRQGVAFNETQKEAIKNYIAQGKLSEAQGVILKELNNEFGGQAKAFAGTDEGKVKMAAKAWDEVKIKIGEIISKIEVALIPAFLKFVNITKYIVNSSSFQFLLSALGLILKIMIPVVAIWAGYKLQLIAVEAYQKIAAISANLLGSSMATVGEETAAATLSWESFSAALASTGIGALVAGLGLLIGKLIEVNEQIDESVDKATGFKKIAETTKSITEKKSETDLTFSNLKNLLPVERSKLLSDLMEQKKNIEEKLTTEISPSVPAAQKYQKQAAEANKASWLSSAFALVTSGGASSAFSLKYAASQTSSTAAEATKQNTEAQKKVETASRDLSKQISFLQKNGIKPQTLPGSELQNQTKADSLNISALSGANGGLGQAKVINIHIDTVQKNIGVKDSAESKDAAVAYLLRAINNLSASQNSM